MKPVIKASKDSMPDAGKPRSLHRQLTVHRKARQEIIDSADILPILCDVTVYEIPANRPSQYLPSSHWFRRRTAKLDILEVRSQR
jgi:hypothetical protein